MRDLDKLVRQFAAGVMAQKEHLRQCDSRRGNIAARKYIVAWQQLKREGDAGREALAQLLTDDRADVRAMAAACLLRYKTKEAKQVLREVAKGEGLAAFGASEALQRWEEGDWYLDPE